MTTRGDADGVVLIAESGVVKHGTDSVGVASQSCGAVGNVANCPVGVYLGYTSATGSTLVDGRRHLPEAWFDDAHAEVPFQTTPELARALLQAAVRRGSVPFRLRVQLQGVADARTIEQVRLLLVSVLPTPVFDAAAALRFVRYYQHRNYVAYLSHRKTRLRRLMATAPPG